MLILLTLQIEQINVTCSIRRMLKNECRIVNNTIWHLSIFCVIWPLGQIYHLNLRFISQIPIAAKWTFNKGGQFLRVWVIYSFNFYILSAFHNCIGLIHRLIFLSTIMSGNKSVCCTSLHKQCKTQLVYIFSISKWL